MTQIFLRIVTTFLVCHQNLNSDLTQNSLRCNHCNYVNFDENQHKDHESSYYIPKDQMNNLLSTSIDKD